MTRFYLPSTGTPSASPAYSAEWNQTTQATRRTMVTTRISSAMANAYVGSGTTIDHDMLCRQYVYAGLVAQTITGTMKGQAKASEEVASHNSHSQIIAKVVSSDGSTVRGVLYAGDTRTGTVDEWTTTQRNQQVPAASATGATAGVVTLSSVVAQTNDLLVIEIGYRNGSTVAGDSGYVFGDNSATDLTAAGTETTANNPWIEFSQDILAGEEPPPDPPGPPISPGTHRVTFWMNSDWVRVLSNANLDLWKSRGVDGYVMSAGRLEGLGDDGTRLWTGNAVTRDAGGGYAFQKAIHDSDIVARCHARGIKLYLACYLHNGTNSLTPLKEWNDNAGWSGTVIPAFTNWAAAATLEGFDGLAFDGEMYFGGSTWDWNYAGNTGQTATRNKVRDRGAEIMTAILAQFPNVEIVNYRHEFVGALKDQAGLPSWGDSTMVNFWNGMSSVNGYAALRFWDESLYKQHYPSVASTWAQGVQLAVSGTRATFASQWSNWAAASSKTFVGAFTWIDNGNDPPEDDALSIPEHEAQMLAARDYSEGNEFGVFCFRNFPGSFVSPGWTNYLPGLAAASLDTASRARWGSLPI